MPGPAAPGVAARRLASRAWAPLSDAEWTALSPLLAARARRSGRPAGNMRRTVDAVFWVAASGKPWRALPDALGRPATAHQALRRWARNGIWHRLLVACCPASGAPPRGLASLAWLVARAFRRIGRLLPVPALANAESRQLADALPAWPFRPPSPTLSKSTTLLVRGAIFSARAGEATDARDLMRAALSAVRAEQARLRAWRWR